VIEGILITVGDSSSFSVYYIISGANWKCKLLSSKCWSEGLVASRT